MNSQNPFELKTVLGFDSTVNLLNLTETPTNVIVAVSSGHVLSIYHESTGRVQHLMGGHETAIQQLDCDISGRFLVSASVSTCVVWHRKDLDTTLPIALRLIDNPFGKDGQIQFIALSGDAKYLAMIGAKGNKKQRKVYELQFWSWSAGSEHPDYKFDLPTQECGKVKDVIFDRFGEADPDGPTTTTFAVTMSRNVLFGSWNPKTRTVDMVKPKMEGKQCTFTMTIFTAISTAITLTGQRFGTIWSIDSNTKKYAKEKLVRLCGQNLRRLVFVDGVVMVLAESGHLLVFDHRLKLLLLPDFDTYSQYVMFNLKERAYRLVDSNTFDDPESGGRDADVEVLFKENLPVTNEKKLFVMRQFVGVTISCEIFAMDFIHRTRKELSIIQSPSIINTFDVLPEKGFILAGCANGRLFKYDYHNMKLCVSGFVKKDNGTEYREPINSVLFTKCNNFVLVAIRNRIHLIDEMFLNQIEAPFVPTNRTIESMFYSECKTLLACSDSEFNVILARRIVTDTGHHYLKLIGVHQAHGRTITTMLFVGNRLFTFSKDYYFAEYDVQKSILAEDLHFVQMVRFDQFSIPLYVLPLDQTLSGLNCDACLLVGDSDFKCRFWQLPAMNLVKTVVGPVLYNEPVKHVCLVDPIDGDPNRYLAFATEGKVLGLQMLPCTGNSFQNIGMLAHSVGIRKIYVIPNTQRLISLGMKEFSISMWTMNTDSVLRNYERGGTGLLPFCKALPGGKEGWLFREMQALFYYMQILTSSLDDPEEKHVGNTIVLAEAPDYLRALGYFPSEQEVANILYELSDQRPQIVKHLRTSFGELLKVYVNHKPVKGYSMESLMNTMAVMVGSRDNLNTAVVDINDLIQMCCTQGEAMGSLECVSYLRILFHADNRPLPALIKPDHKRSELDSDLATEMMSQMPEVLDLVDFMKLLFGVELSDEQAKTMLYAGVLDPGAINEKLNNNVLKDDSSESDDEDDSSPEEEEEKNLNKK